MKNVNRILTAIVGVLVIVIVGFATLWFSTTSEASSLKNEKTDLQENLGELQENFNNLQQNYNVLNSSYVELEENHGRLQENFDELQGNYNNLNSIYNNLNSSYGDLQDKYAQLEENLEPSFPSGTTYNQVIAWDSIRVSLIDAHTRIGDMYVDSYINLLQYKTAHEYIRSWMPNLINDIEVIRHNASSNWNASINKFIEAAEWDIRGFDNYALYAETWLESCYNSYLTCYNNSVSAQTVAWDLMST